MKCFTISGRPMASYLCYPDEAAVINDLPPVTAKIFCRSFGRNNRRKLTALVCDLIGAQYRRQYRIGGYALTNVKEVAA